MGERKIYTEDQDISSVVKQMNEIFYLLSSIKIEDEDFIHQLAVHLQLAGLRYKYGIAIDNPLIDQIKTKYSSIYGIMREVVKPIEETQGTPISESEIGFITLYYAGKVANKNRNVPKVSTLVICLNGLSTSYLLKNEIENLDSRIEVTECVGLREYNSQDHHADLVVSTVPFTPKQGDRAITIHPILTFEDKMAIGNIISKIIFGSETAPSYSKVLDVVKPYISREKLDAAKQTLRHFYEKTDSHTKSIANNEIFRSDFVAIDNSSDSWEDLIKKAAGPLISSGYIHEDYIHEMIETIYEYGSYSVFQHGYLLGHASAEKSRHLGLSFLRLSKPVDIMGNLVSKILIITPNDYTSHLPYIFRLLNLFNSDEADKKVMNAKTSEEIYDIVIRYLIA
jgi:mannitol operon transcriptional antiterminator